MAACVMETVTDNGRKFDNFVMNLDKLLHKSRYPVENMQRNFIVTELVNYNNKTINANFSDNSYPPLCYTHLPD